MTRDHCYQGRSPFGIAHRGGAAEFPENTLDAFRQAAKLGFGCIETDVHVSADGELFAFHDDRLDRVTDRRGVIAELTAAEVRSARVDGGHAIPTLSELLEELPSITLNIDPKHDAAVQPLARILRHHAAFDRVCVGAFSDRRLKQFRELTDGLVATSLGPRGVAALLAKGRGLPARPFVEVAAQVPTTIKGRPLVTQRFVQTTHRLGLQVHVWTIDDAEEMHALFDLGVDAIITDRPSVLREVLISRGAW